MRLLASRCLLAPGEVARDVLIEVVEGRVTRVAAEATRRGADLEGAVRLEGLVVPGFANTHSHVFHRALRGRAALGGDFWSWREGMYRLAAALDPGSYHAIARLVFAEMLRAGFTSVGEFHYLHHAPSGASYDDPNAMGRALIEAAHEAGVRLRLLETCYLYGGLSSGGYRPLGPAQQRFGDGDVDSFLARVDELASREPEAIGYAIHSVRAVAPAQMAEVAKAAGTLPLHVHVSEQPAENAAALAAFGRSPTALLAEAGALGRSTTLVHCNHPLAGDLELIGREHATVSRCPSTEEDLGDGLAPTAVMLAHGARLAIGTDQQAAIDPFREARSLELHERLRTGRRGLLGAPVLWEALWRHESLGFDDAGRIAPGYRADLVEIDCEAVETAGADAAEVVMAATPTAIRRVLVGGREVVRDGVHLGIPELGRELAALLATLRQKEEA
jgi:formiminoglutamate deiminase